LNPHQDIFEMAAALHYSLVVNHPFVDGNKRAALLSALTFLDLNGYAIDRPSQILAEITLGVASGWRMLPTFGAALQPSRNG
jgi:death on curing protein